jgi:hypothetical protein
MTSQPSPERPSSRNAGRRAGDGRSWASRRSRSAGRGVCGLAGLEEGRHFAVKMPAGGGKGHVSILKEGLAYAA